jgi:hypothetical protein
VYNWENAGFRGLSDIFRSTSSRPSEATSQEELKESMRKFLSRYFDGLPPGIEQALLARLEEVIIMIYSRHDASLRSNEISMMTKEEVSAAIWGVLALANDLKNKLTIDKL